MLFAHCGTGSAFVASNLRVLVLKSGVVMAEEMKQCCACRHKETERADDLQHDLTKRLNRAIGQLNGVKDMIADNRYCGDVLVQLAAAESALHKVSEIVLKNHLETCVVEQIQQGNTEIIDEAMQLIKKFGGR